MLPRNERALPMNRLDRNAFWNFCVDCISVYSSCGSIKHVFCGFDRIRCQSAQLVLEVEEHRNAGNGVDQAP